jgi:hypothetical protein
MMTRENCSRCGALCEAVSFQREEGPQLPALARDAAGVAVCDVCCAAEAVGSLVAGLPASLYVSSCGRYLVTFGGTVVARVRDTGYGGSAANGTTLTRYVATVLRPSDGLPDVNAAGVLRCWGRGLGAGMLLTARPYKNRQPY